MKKYIQISLFLWLHIFCNQSYSKEYFRLSAGMKASDIFTESGIKSANERINLIAETEGYNIVISVGSGIIDPFNDEKKEKVKLKEKGYKLAKTNFKRYKVDKKTKDESQSHKTQHNLYRVYDPIQRKK